MVRNLFWTAMLSATMLTGCSKAAPPPAKAVITTKPVDTTPGVVALSNAKAVRTAENIIHVEVAYKFTSGEPIKHYMLDLAFPGTTVSGKKPMDAWEVKPEGMIKTSLPVADPEAKTYEITFSEADSPDRGYHVISNKLTGEVEPAPESMK